tara:strand:- start:13411 stop:13905 length:495 start_codon:yes stop_codon:yes gene_type:complete
MLKNRKKGIRTLLKNKKGDFETSLTSIFWLVMIFVITIVVIAFFLIISSYQQNVVSVPSELQAELISLRFTNIPECFAYHINNVTQAGVIDLQKFNDEQMLKCYQTENKKTYNFRLRLKETKREVLSNNYRSKDDFTIFKNVLVRDGNQLKKDKLIIYVQEAIG